MKRNRKTVPKPENEVKTVQKLQSNEELPQQHFENQTLLTAHLTKRDWRAGVLKSSKKSRENNSAVRTVDVDYEYALLKKSL